MKILVTGAKGFIGTNLCKQLQQHEVITWDRVDGDLCRIRSFPEVDVVIHLAAMVTTKEFYTKGFEVVKNNITPTLNLLEFYRQQNKKPLFMYAGTPESYAGATDLYNYKIPTDEKAPFVIDDPTNLRWSYAGSKALGEQAVIASGLDYIIFRPHNIYGPNQEGHFVSDFVGRAKKNDFTLFGGTNMRTWCYIDDFCDALVKLMTCETAIGEIVNIGGTEEQTIYDTAKQILDIMNIDQEIIVHEAPKGSTNRRKADISKIQSMIDWTPTTTLKQGLTKTLETL